MRCSASHMRRCPARSVRRGDSTPVICSKPAGPCCAPLCGLCSSPRGPTRQHIRPAPWFGRAHDCEGHGDCGGAGETATGLRQLPQDVRIRVCGEESECPEVEVVEGAQGGEGIMVLKGRSAGVVAVRAAQFQKRELTAADVAAKKTEARDQLPGLVLGSRGLALLSGERIWLFGNAKASDFRVSSIGDLFVTPWPGIFTGRRNCGSHFASIAGHGCFFLPGFSCSALGLYRSRHPPQSASWGKSLMVSVDMPRSYGSPGHSSARAAVTVAGSVSMRRPAAMAFAVSRAAVAATSPASPAAVRRSTPRALSLPR